MTKTSDPRGIESLKTLLKFVILTAQKLSTIDSNKDHKISLMEALIVIPPLALKVSPAFSAIPAAREEWKDLTREEIAELARWFAEEFDLPLLEHSKLEAIIKKTTQIITTNYQYYEDIKAILG